MDGSTTISPVETQLPADTEIFLLLTHLPKDKVRQLNSIIQTEEANHAIIRYKNTKGTQNVPFNKKLVVWRQIERINYVLLCMAINLWTDK